VPITGLNAGEFLEGIDFRPVDGLIYAIARNGTSERMVTIHPTFGTVTAVGAAAVTANGSSFGLDFNPVVDRIRSVDEADNNRRFDPNNGTLVVTDTPLAYAPGDPGAGSNPSLIHVAYSNSQVGATSTTLYGIDSFRDVLVTVGGPGGVPSPNGGQLFTVGPLGVDGSNFGGFDIQPFTNTAYAALTTGGVSALYRIDLATGAASPIGAIGGGTTIDGLTVAVCTTAAEVSISGRVLTADGVGIRNARMFLSGGSLPAPRQVATSSFGYYNFEDLEVGQTYVLTVNSRRYTFQVPSRVISLVDHLTDVDFIADAPAIVP